MLKNLMLISALSIGIGAPLAVSAQDAPAKEAKKASGESAAKAEKPELPKDDAKARKALKDAYGKIYSAKAKGMKKLHGEMKLSAKVAYDFMGQKGTATDVVDYRFVWDGENDVATKDVTEKQPDMMGRMLRQTLKSDAEMVTGILQSMIGTEDFDKKYTKENSAFEFLKQTEEEAKAKVQRIEVTMLVEVKQEESDASEGDEDSDKKEEKEFKLEQRTHILADGVLASIPVDDEQNLKVTFQKKGRDLFFKTVAISSELGIPAMPSEDGEEEEEAEKMEKTYEFSDIKKAGKYKMPTTIKVASKFGRFGEGETVITLKNFKVDKKVTDKMIEAVMPKEDDEHGDAGVEEVKKGEEEKGGEGEESPIKGLSKARYDRIKSMMKGRNGGKEPTDKEIEDMIKQWGGGAGGRGGNRGGNRGGRRGR